MGMAERAKIRRMQESLSVIRNVARWTTGRLGEEIGVSRQTINSLEHNKTTMTKTQYLALRAVFNNEAMVNGNAALAQVIQSLVDEPIEERCPEDEAWQEDAEGKVSKLDTMDALSAATNVLSNKKLVAAIGAVLPTAAIPGLAGLVMAPIINEVIKGGTK